MVKPEPLLLQKNLGREVATFFKNFTKIKNLAHVCVNTHRFFVVHFNFFIRTTTGFAVPAELGMAQFSVKDGILDVFSTILNLCDMPKGYSFHAKEQSEKTHRIPVPPPKDMKNVITDPRDLLRIICNFIRGVALDTADELEEEKVIALFSETPLFTLAEDRAIITEGFEAIMGEAGFESKVPVMLLPVEGLFVHLLKLANQEQDCKPPRVTSKMADLFNPDRLKNHMKLACLFHVEEADDAEFCSLARVKRWVFELTAPVCTLLNIPLEEDKHWPRGVQRLSSSALEGAASSKGDFGVSHFGGGGRLRSPSPRGRTSRERLMSRRSRDRDSPEYREYRGKRERLDSRSSRERHGDRDRDSPKNKSHRKSSDEKKSSSSRRSRHDSPEKWSRSRRSRDRSSERREEKYRLKQEPHSIPPLMCDGAAGPSRGPTKPANEKRSASHAPRLTAVQREPEESASVPSETPSPHQQDRRASAGNPTAVSSAPAVPDGGSHHVESTLELRFASPMPRGASSVAQPAGPPPRPISGALQRPRELAQNPGRSYEIPYHTARMELQNLRRGCLRVINPITEFTLNGAETFSHPGMHPVGTQQPPPGAQQGTIPISGSTLNFGGGNGIPQMSAPAGVGTQQPAPGVQQGASPLSGSTLNFGGGNGILQMSAAGVGTQQPSPGVLQGTYSPTMNLGGSRTIQTSPAHGGVPHQTSPGGQQGSSLYGPTMNLGGGGGGGGKTNQTSPAHGGVPHQTSPGGQQGFPLFGPTVNLGGGGGGGKTNQTSPAHGGVPHQTSPGGQQGSSLYGPTVNLGGGNRTLDMPPATVGMQQPTAPGPVPSTNNSPPGSAPVRTSMFQDASMMHATVDPRMSQGAWYYVPAGGIPPGAVGPLMAPNMAPSAAGPHMMPPPNMAPSAGGPHMMPPSNMAPSAAGPHMMPPPNMAPSAAGPHMMPPPNPYMMPPNPYMGYTAMNYGHTGYLPPGIHPYQIAPPANYMPAPNPYPGVGMSAPAASQVPTANPNPVATTSAPASNHVSAPNPYPVASTSAPAATPVPAPNPIPDAATAAANHPAPTATPGRMDMFSSPDALRTTPASAPSQGLAAPRPVDAEGRTLLNVEVSGVSDGGPAETVQVKQEPVSRIRGENPHGVAWQLHSFSGDCGT